MDLSLLFSAVVAFSTVVYALLTWRLVSETRKLRRQQNTPDVNIHFETAEALGGIVFLIVENIGLGVAQKVNLKLVKNFKQYDKHTRNLAELNIFNSQILNFYPNQRFRYFYTNLREDTGVKLKDSCTIELSYFDIFNKEHKKQFKLSLGEFTHLTRTDPPDTYMGLIPYELKKIRKLLDKRLEE